MAQAAAWTVVPRASFGVARFDRFAVSPHQIPASTEFVVQRTAPVDVPHAAAPHMTVAPAGAGVAVAPGDATALADAVERLAGTTPEALADMGERGRRFVVDRFGKRRVIDQLEAILAAQAKLGRTS